MKPAIRCLILIMMLCLLPPRSPSLAEQAASESAAAEQALSEEATAVTLPEGFEPLRPAKANISKYLTPLRIPGIEPTVYAYLDQSGAVVFLVYGRLDKKKGMFEAQLSAQREGEAWAFELNVTGTEPHKGIERNLGRPKGVKLNTATLPEGYKKTSKTGVCYFTNLFGVKEYRVLGRLSGRADSYYPAQYGRPKPGGLPIDISKDRERFLEKGEKKQKLPRKYKNGFATAVLVLTRQGEWVSVMTDKPALELENK